jgi:hypothetical protein
MNKYKKAPAVMDFKKAERHDKLMKLRAQCPTYEEVLEHICNLIEEGETNRAKELELAKTKTASTFRLIGSQRARKAS